MFTFFIKCQYCNITQRFFKKAVLSFSPALESLLSPPDVCAASQDLFLVTPTLAAVKHHNLEAPQLALGVSLN